MKHILILLSLCCFLSGLAADEKKPNIIYILADDLGYSELGCYGQQKIKTPSLDKIAAEGIKFTQHYSGSAVCAPSRCVLLTGKHSGNAHIRGNGRAPGKKEGQRPLPTGTETLGTLMQRAGYTTGCIGKWGLGGPGDEGDPDKQGFDHFFGYLCQATAHNFYPPYLWRNGEKVELDNKQFSSHQKFPKKADPNDPKAYEAYAGKVYSHDLLAEEALNFIRDNKEKPFFLYLPFTIPHVSLQVPADSLAEYDFPEKPYLGNKGYLPHPKPRAAYAAMITRMDKDIGRIMELLKELNIDEDTLVIFTSDNGPTFNGGSDSAFFDSAADMRGLKCSLYEGGIRIPMIARWPGKIQSSSVTEHISAFQDVLPTFADLSGQALKSETDGLSFLPTLLGKDEAQKKHKSLYFEYAGQQCLRMGDWKIYRRAAKPDKIELYNLKKDKGEKNDLASKMPEIVSTARRILESSRSESTLFPLVKTKAKKKSRKK
ncbi:MAG: arylsulfatase [Lentisphaeraceae bacterium]|nr:arylsulfatase [Lentisphaeraceae bacterium]